MEELKNKIRDVPDFPKKGIIFKDITTLLKDGGALQQTVNLISNHLRGKEIDLIVAIEARGFILGGALAYKLSTGMVPVRKKGKLPAATFEVTYALEYGNDTLEIHQDAIKTGEKILVVDDLLATGGTSLAVAKLVEGLEGKIIEMIFLIELEFLKGREKLNRYPVFSLLKY